MIRLEIMRGRTKKSINTIIVSMIANIIILVWKPGVPVPKQIGIGPIMIHPPIPPDTFPPLLVIL